MFLYRILELRMPIPQHFFTRLLQSVIPLPFVSLLVLPFAVQYQHRRKHDRHAKHTDIDCVAGGILGSIFGLEVSMIPLK
jgi:hypothetical protein